MKKKEKKVQTCVGFDRVVGVPKEFLDIYKC